MPGAVLNEENGLPNGHSPFDRVVIRNDAKVPPQLSANAEATDEAAAAGKLRDTG